MSIQNWNRLDRIVIINSDDWELVSNLLLKFESIPSYSPDSYNNIVISLTAIFLRSPPHTPSRLKRIISYWLFSFSVSLYL